MQLQMYIFFLKKKIICSFFCIGRFNNQLLHFVCKLSIRAKSFFTLIVIHLRCFFLIYPFASITIKFSINGTFMSPYLSYNYDY